MIPKLALLPLALGPVALTGCATSSYDEVSMLVSSSTGRPVWSYITESEKGGQFFIDYSTRSRQGDTVRIWVKALNPSSPGGVLSARVLQEYDCRNGTRRMVHGTFFTGPDLTGDIIYSGAFSPPENLVEPETIGEIVFKAVYN